uniref:Putative exporter protein n=1 Tax=uncultured marine microorganism TaxID=415540 RepID=A5CFR8_9ZZZZ|nr:putative exporter protein [uncultured marine microorganism]
MCCVKLFWRITAEFIWQWRFLLAAICFVITALAALQLGALTVSNSLEIWYPEDDPELIQYRGFQKQYGNDEVVIAAVTSEEGFDHEDGDGLLEELTDRLFDIDGVASVSSRITVPLSLRDARDRLLSEDGRTTVLIVQMMAGTEIEAQRHRILEDIKSTFEAFDLPYYLAGYGVIYDALNEESTVGAATLIISAHALMILLLLLFFRRPVPVIVTLLAVGFAITWTMGLYVALGRQLNMVTMALPTLVLVIGIADGVHLLRAVAAEPRDLPHAERIIRALAAMLPPCFVTSVTTAAGFLALTTSSLPIVRDLGLFGAIGMLCAFVASFVMLTAALSWRATEPKPDDGGVDRLAARLTAVGLKYPARTIGAFAVAGSVFLFGLTGLVVDTDSYGYFEQDHVVLRDSDFIQNTMGPYAPMDFVVEAPANVLSADILDAVQAWQVDVVAEEGIGWSWSLLDALAIEQSIPPSSLPADEIRSRLERIRRFSPVTIASMIAGDTQLRISFGTEVMSARTVQDLMDRIQDYAEFPDGVELRPAGYTPLYTRIVDEIVSSQLKGFATALILIAVLLGLGMRSLWRVALAIPANLFPVLLTLGLMGLIGIPLDVATATIATVILGLVVDDTVHMLRPPDDSANASLSDSLLNSSRKSGGTLLITSFILALGFLVLGLAEIRSIAWFGFLTSFAMAVAIIADLMLLPALARLADARSA